MLGNIGILKTNIIQKGSRGKSEDLFKSVSLKSGFAVIRELCPKETVLDEIPNPVFWKK